MLHTHSELVSFVWAIANLLRGPYKPAQYRKVMLPLIVLRRLDCVLAPTKHKVIEEYKRLQAAGMAEGLIDQRLKAIAGTAFYNTSQLDFEKMVAAHENLAADLKAYIRSFSPNASEIITRFEFEKEIDKLEENNVLFLVMQRFADPKFDLSPYKVSNLQMGYVFEELIRKFNEQANEEAGDHFTPREVIRLMTHLIYTYDTDVFKEGKVVTVFDPACGTGGMLSESVNYIKELNTSVNVEVFGQDYNPESWAICASDMLIKGQSPDNIKMGDSLGDGKTEDAYRGRSFQYMLANPPFGVEWKKQKDIVTKEYETLGFSGRFGAGLPSISDGSLLFLQHMIAKMEHSPEQGGNGSRIAIVFNGSPLFTGDAGSGPSNIRRWIIENDWLDAIIALPDQLFYNTGIYTYIWLVTNKKETPRKGKVQLINAVNMYEKMRKSLGNKRNEISEEQISEITRLYGEFEETEHSKIFTNAEFGYVKLTVDRPLRLKFQVNEDAIERVRLEKAYQNLATSKKKKDKEAYDREIREGQALQLQIVTMLKDFIEETIYTSRKMFLRQLDQLAKSHDLKLPAPLKKAIWKAIGERDEEAEICRDKKGNPEPDTDLRDTEMVPLPADLELPLPLQFDNDTHLDDTISIVKPFCQEYFEQEVLPHVPDAWVDWEKTKIGYEIPINRHFYKYAPPRPLEEIDAEIKALEREIVDMLSDITK